MYGGSCAGGLRTQLTPEELAETAAVARRAGEIAKTGFANNRGVPGRPADPGLAHAVTAYGARHRAGPTNQPTSGWCKYARNPDANPALVARYDTAMLV